ncbi:YolD-like family protein [Bacillus sp. AFS040349]|uniref:YolD-like family protein n=1 Tax=Bacillus sp. AFS040349 TaxID=2033502 RepID=UPI00159BB13B|nr:YolD-like family protein [Bacillus sp. AFS040349]
MSEHKELLKKVDIDLQKVEKPLLDEYKIADINDVIVVSIQDQVEIKIEIWKDGFIETVAPVVVTKIDPILRKMYIKHQNYAYFIFFDSLVDATIL